MKACYTTALSILILFSNEVGSCAQTKNTQWSQKSTSSSIKNNEKTDDAQMANQHLRRMLDTINNSWFGNTYADINAVDIQGNLTINLKASDVNERIRRANKYDEKITPIVGDYKVNLKVTGTYFANANFRVELSGGFGNLIYYRVGNKGFLYSREQNAWTSRVEPPPSDAPSYFMVWFKQCMDEIQTTYLNRSIFKSSTGKETDRIQTMTFASKTAHYNANKMEQTIDESLDFWKSGKVEITLDKATYQPQQMHYSNESQGIYTDTIFHYNANNKPSSLAIINKSKDMSGPMSINVNYNNNGLIDHISGKTTFGKGSIKFNLGLNFVKDRKVTSIITVPPPTATKKSREELEMLLLVNAGGKMRELQQVGLGMRGLKVTGQ
jgi:hypothetical protein